MGNSQSSRPTSSHPKPRHTITRQRSAVFSKLSLGCTSGNGSILGSDTSNETLSLVNEKAAVFRERENDTQQPQHNYRLRGQESTRPGVFSCLRHRQDESTAAYTTSFAPSLNTADLVLTCRCHSSQLSAKCASEAREAVLSFFRAPPEYTVVFTANATAALKLVGEAYPFAAGGCYVLSADSHKACMAFANMPLTGEPVSAIFLLLQQEAWIPQRQRPRSKETAPCLFALTGQSNITNAKNSLSLIEYAASLGYHTLLDAAALVPTSVFSLSETPVDAMVVSFYKMFGFPTGVGALVVKKSFLAQLERPWFAGGNVDVVQVPGNIVTRSHHLHERFEVCQLAQLMELILGPTWTGWTINYLNLPAVVDGLRFLSATFRSCPTIVVSPPLSDKQPTQLKHDTNGAPVVRILSRLPKRRLMTVGEQADCGSIISLIFLSVGILIHAASTVTDCSPKPSGEMIPNSFVEYAASKESVSLRTGCMCNPGGAAAILSIQDDMKQLYPGVTLKDFEHHVGRELGVVRISFGLASNFQDAWRILKFASSIATEKSRQELWSQWLQEKERECIGKAI
ncbi:Molybdenum cofactor sulfurase [Salix suchowensis]|nr:Molybdenum cofactor sulfurase [Salix suchowensis]